MPICEPSTSITLTSGARIWALTRTWGSLVGGVL